jgi:putative transposase
LVVHVAAIQDRDGAKLLMMRIAGRFSRLSLIWADGGYAGKLVEWAQAFGSWILEIVKRPEGCGSSSQVGRRTHVRLAWPFPAAQQRLRGIGEDQRGHGSYKHDPLDDQAIVAMMKSFQNRL